jgi:thioredoxin 2
VSDGVHVVCGNCGGINRVPRARIEEDPKCGKCKASLLKGPPAELTEQTFAPFIGRNELPVVVDFWADWCAPCKMMAPVFAQAAREQGTRVRFAKIDTDAAPGISQRYAIRSIPSLLLFRGGAEVDRAVGALDAARLRAWLSDRTL